MDRIETIYQAIDQMAISHGTPRPEKFGGGTWNFDEEIELWKQHIQERETNPLTPLQWGIIDTYINTKRGELRL